MSEPVKLTEGAENLPALTNNDVQASVEYFGVVPGDPLFNAFVTCYNFGHRMASGDEAGARSLAYENREDLGACWRRFKEIEKAIKQFKPVIEFIAGQVSMPDVFKWQAGAKREKKEVLASCMPELWHRLEAQGVTLDAFLTCCKIDFKAAVELSGFNETKFREEFAGDLCNFETSQNKPTLKGLA